MLFAIKVQGKPGAYEVEVLYKMARGRIIRRAAERKVGTSAAEVVRDVLAGLVAKGILKE